MVSHTLGYANRLSYHVKLSSLSFDSPQEAHRETPGSGQTTHDDLSHFRLRLAQDGIMSACGKSTH